MINKKKEDDFRSNQKENILKEHILKKSNSLDDWPEIKGYDFEEEFSFENLMKSYLRTGLQASSLGQAFEIINNMRKEKAKIFLGFTSNMGTSGIREHIKFLVKNKYIDVISTSTGAIEEDIIKCFKPFVLGDFRTQGSILRDEGINRTGNIFIPNDRYIYFERFMNKFLERIYHKQKKNKDNIIGIKEFVFELGHELEIQNVEKREESFVYWSYKNNIPIFCPALPDGSIGDMIYFFKKNFTDFKIDTSDYIVQVTDLALNCEKMGAIIIGGGVPKHLIANAALFREGCEFIVYINSGLEMEGSNAGAPIDEAVSWGKIKSNAMKVKVECEASLVFPLICAYCFKLKK